MNIKVTLAIITGIVAIVVAVIQFGPGWFSSGEGDPKPGNGKNEQSITTGYIEAGRDVEISQVMNVNRELNVAEKIIEDQSWSEAESDPAFRRFVRSRFHKNIEELDTAERATFWQDMQKYLDEEKEADKKYAKIKQQTVGDELKSLFSKIDEAKGLFDYDEVDRLLQEIEEKHVDLISDLAKVFYLRGQNLELQIRYRDAETYYRKAEALENQNPLYLNDYAGILSKLGKYGEAELLLRRALQIREKQLGPEHPDVASSLNNLAGLLQAQGKYSESEPLYRRALGIDEKALGSDHPNVATSLNNLAVLLQVQGKYSESEPLYRRALAILEKQLGPDHPTFAKSLNNLAVLLQAQSKYSESEPLYRRALEIYKKQLDPEHPTVARSLNNLAALLQAQGRYSEAEPLFRDALEIREKQLGPEHPDVASSLNNLAGLLQVQGKYAEAEPLYLRASVILEKQLGPEHPNTITARKNLTRLQEEMQDK